MFNGFYRCLCVEVCVWGGGGGGEKFLYKYYSRTSMARPPFRPWKLVRDRGSSSQ